MSKKHYIITSITLGAVAAVAAGVIGLTNFLTKDRIAHNEQVKIEKGIKAIFGNDSEILDEFTISDSNYKYLVYGYSIKNDDTGLNRFAIKTLGSNTYGKISLIVGVSESSTHNYMFTKFSVVVDEQSYASTLEENYIEPVNDGSRQYIDVSCGATYGATLIKDMIDMTLSYASDVLGAE